MITLIDRSRTKVENGVLTHSTLDAIEEAVKNGKKVLVYLNRRWAFRAFVCEDCSYQWMCPHCDVGLTLHTSPSPRLLCHHCWHESRLPEHCPKCSGHNIKWVGTGLQEVERFLRSHLKNTGIARIDSDTKELSDTGSSVVLATEYVLRHDIGKRDLLVVVTPEAELSIPEFDIEERVYCHIRYLCENCEEVIIETSIPKSPLIMDLVHGNYKDFLIRTLSERKKYHYPPYGNIAYLEIRERNEDRLMQKTATLVNKLEILSESRKWSGNSEIIFDKSMRKKRSGEWIDTIVLRSDDLEWLIAWIEGEILRNRGLFLEIRGRKAL